MNRSLPDIPKEWIQQARLADESAIEKIYSKTYPKAYTIAYYSLGATNKFQDEAQTITQDSMRKAFEKLDQLKDDDKFAPWMYTILNNSIRDYFRAHKNKDYQTNTFSELDSEDFRDNYEESIADDSVVFSPEANMNTELIAEGLKECLDKLPDNQRFALMMQMYQQLTTKEIAEQMEVEENTVKSWIRRAKLSIKDMIEELRRQNKSFYTVAPLPFLAWMLDQELKNIPEVKACELDYVMKALKSTKDSFKDAATIKKEPSHTYSKQSGMPSMNDGNFKSTVFKAIQSGEKGFLSTTAGKAIAGAMAVFIAGGVVMGVSSVFSKDEPSHQNQTVVQQSNNRRTTKDTVKKVEKKKPKEEEKKTEETVYDYKPGIYDMLVDKYTLYRDIYKMEEANLIMTRGTIAKDEDENEVGEPVTTVSISKVVSTKNKETGKTQYWGRLKTWHTYVLIREGENEYLSFITDDVVLKNRGGGTNPKDFADRVCGTYAEEKYPNFSKTKIENVYNSFTVDCSGRISFA
ncbi:RNA polymerase sigma factor [Holdemanella biformis]|uniref:RNA polymerase sigma factor n=2 Tax=Holdemanella biformis TaxID=1735 RepID=UPI00189C2D66|nr:sigma-70 family RNA polymerase sigma factor [Holdemanella biformis]